MATAKANKKKAAVAVDLPECPICLDTMTAPIFQCQSGHSLCSNCTSSLCPPVCPICRQPMTQMRNWQLEELIIRAKVPCPNKGAGCVYTMAALDVDEHVKECIFRVMDCPIGVVFGKCSWQGTLKELMDHYKERHPNNCNITTDADVKLNNVNINEDERHMYLYAQGKMLFVLTFKIDTLQKMAYFAIQHIGSKKAAHQHIYEIHLTSKKDERRKVVFIEHCFNDALKADEVFRLSKCGVLPLEGLNHFIKDKQLSFRFFIKRIPPASKNNKNDKGDGKDGKGDKPNNNKPNFNNKPKGPGPKPGFTPKGPGPRHNKAQA